MYVYVCAPMCEYIIRKLIKIQVYDQPKLLYCIALVKILICDYYTSVVCKVLTDIFDYREKM